MTAWTLTARLSGILTCLFLCGMTGRAAAEEWLIQGSRYQAMGGAGVAIAEGSAAVHWNPGGLAFANRESEFELPLNASLAAVGDILKDADEVAQFIQDNSFADVLDRMQTGQALTVTDLQNALQLAGRLTDLAQRGEGMLGNPKGGIKTRWGRLALTADFGGSFGIDPGFDPFNLAFSSAGSVTTQIANVVGAGADRTGQFSDPGSQLLADAISSGLVDWSQNQAEELVFQAEQAGLSPSDAGVQTLLTQIAQSTADQVTGDLSQNLSGATTQALLTQEVGLSYGLPLFGDLIGIGGSVRYVRGTTYHQFIQYDQITSSDDLIDDLMDANNREVSQNVGLDLGLMVRPRDWLRLGLVGKNLNGPDFGSEGPDDLELEPQVRAGIAIQPVSNWLVAVDIDITENDSVAIEDYRSRMLSVGTEYRIPLPKGHVALRTGAYTNLAQEASDEFTLTGGVGLRVGGFEFELAAGASPHFEEIEASGDDWPSHVNLSGAIRFTREF